MECAPAVGRPTWPNERKACAEASAAIVSGVASMLEWLSGCVLVCTMYVREKYNVMIR